MSSFNEYLLSLKENVSNSMVTTLTPNEPVTSHMSLVFFENK